VTEEIKTRQTAEETTSAVESGRRADTGSARYGAERKLVAHRYAYFAFLCGSSLRIRIHNM